MANKNLTIHLIDDNNISHTICGEFWQDSDKIIVSNSEKIISCKNCIKRLDYLRR